MKTSNLIFLILITSPLKEFFPQLFKIYIKRLKESERLYTHIGFFSKHIFIDWMEK
jgi:hypothetical protein